MATVTAEELKHYRDSVQVRLTVSVSAMSHYRDIFMSGENDNENFKRWMTEKADYIDKFQDFRPGGITNEDESRIRDFITVAACNSGLPNVDLFRRVSVTGVDLAESMTCDVLHRVFIAEQWGTLQNGFEEAHDAMTWGCDMLLLEPEEYRRHEMELKARIEREYAIAVAAIGESHRVADAPPPLDDTDSGAFHIRQWAATFKAHGKSFKTLRKESFSHWSVKATPHKKGYYSCRLADLAKIGVPVPSPDTSDLLHDPA